MKPTGTVMAILAVLALALPAAADWLWRLTDR